MVKPSLRIKLREKKLCKVARWRGNLKEGDPERWEAMKKKDAERKRMEYAQLKEQKEKGDREARAKVKAKNERQKDAQRRYRERVKAKKATVSAATATSTDATATVAAATSAASAADTEDSSLETTEVQTENISREETLSSTPIPGPSGLQKKPQKVQGRQRKTYMAQYRKDLSLQKKNSIHKKDRERKRPTDSSLIHFSIAS